MERNYKNIDLGYEFWNKNYMFHNSIAGEREAYKIWVALYEAGTVKSVDEFLEWMLANRPEMIFNYVEEDRKYRANNEPKIRQYFAEHFEGKEWKDIDPDDWSWYSDWHKDVFGYRPHGIVCGEYINPHI
jgi:hypothetical protein